jgi:two-component system, chemotaxis family, protein-glutamate methylesterase/glutaminase
VSARGHGVSGPVGVTVRVLVAGESRAMRSALRRMLTSDRRLEVVGLASDADEVARSVIRLVPDVIVLDVGMDPSDAFETIGRVMAEHPTAMVVMSATTPEGGESAIRALEMGAVDVLAKPSWSVDPGLGALAEEIVRKILAASRVRPARIAVARPGERAAAAAHPSLPAFSAPAGDAGWTPCVVIAASTGGPAALLSLIPELPRELPASVLVVQHMPAPYTRAFARMLGERASIPVREAAAGDRLARGLVFVCPGSQHLTVGASGEVGLRPAQLASEDSPSADLAMTSVAEQAAGLAIGVVLTGMGRDAALGAAAIRKSGGIVIAQDEASSVVYGMPRAAADMGCVDAMVPLSGLPETMLACVGDLLSHHLRVSHAS